MLDDLDKVETEVYTFYALANNRSELLTQLRIQMEPVLFSVAWDRGQKLEIGALIPELLIDLADASDQT